MNSLASLFTSRKTIRVFLGIIIVIGGLYFMWPTFNTADAKMKAFVGAIVTIGGLLGVDVMGIAHEDAAQKSGPQNQTNVNSDVRNTPLAPAPEPAAHELPPPPYRTAPAPPKPVMVTLNPQSMEAIVAAVVKKLQPPPKDLPPAGE